MTGATGGGDSISGNHDVAFVAAQSELILDGNYTIVHADDHSSLAVTGSDERLIGADVFATATKGSEVWMGGNGVNGVDDTLTASNITATIGGNSNVILHGDDDVATIALDSNTYFVGEGLTAHVGNHATIDINVIDGSGETGALDVLTGGVFNAIVATSANVELDTYEATATLASNVALAVEKIRQCDPCGRYGHDRYSRRCLQSGVSGYGRHGHGRRIRFDLRRQRQRRRDDD